MRSYGLLLLFICFLSSTLHGQETQIPQNQKDQTMDGRQELLEKELKSDPHEKHRQYFKAQMENGESYDSDRFMQEFIKMLLILGVLVGGLLLAAWIFKRAMSTRMEQLNVSSAIKVLERRSVSPKITIYLVEVNDHQIIIGESTNGMTLLSDISMNHASRSRTSFEDILDQSSESKEDF